MCFCCPSYGIKENTTLGQVLATSDFLAMKISPLKEKGIKNHNEITGPTSNKQRQEEEPTISLKGTEQVACSHGFPVTTPRAKVEGSGITL